LVDFADAVARDGHDADAIRILELNVEKYPQSPRALDALARSYEEAGQKDRAIEIYRKMLEIDPQNRNAQRRRQALQSAPKSGTSTRNGATEPDPGAARRHAVCVELPRGAVSRRGRAVCPALGARKEPPMQSGPRAAGKAFSW